jgi:hypothetical protein
VKSLQILQVLVHLLFSICLTLPIGAAIGWYASTPGSRGRRQRKAEPLFVGYRSTLPVVGRGADHSLSVALPCKTAEWRQLDAD